MTFRFSSLTEEAQASAHHVVELAKDTAYGMAAVAAIASPIPYWLSDTNSWFVAMMPSLGVIAMVYLILGRRSYKRYWDSRSDQQSRERERDGRGER